MLDINVPNQKEEKTALGRAVVVLLSRGRAPARVMAGRSGGRRRRRSGVGRAEIEIREAVQQVVVRLQAARGILPLLSQA